LFHAAGIELRDVGLHRPTLDDVFLGLTGHAADPEDASTLSQPNEIMKEVA
jgi:ABC-2 type transport system ATP-binding protein